MSDDVIAPDGSRIALVGVGMSVVHDVASVRVWDVSLAPGDTHPWHLHRNPYVVLSVAGSTARMEWLDGSPARNVEEYAGGAVFRPVSPIHRLTNTGSTQYRNRLIELKALGEDRVEGPMDVGGGVRSVAGEESPATQGLDSRRSVLTTNFVRVWTVPVAGNSETVLKLADVEHVFAEFGASLEGAAVSDSVFTVPGGSYTLSNRQSQERAWFVVSLDYTSTVQ